MDTTTFEFKQCITVLKATGAKAQNLRQLRALIAAGKQRRQHHAPIILFPIP
ncbi:MAG: hypothetical protein WC539_06975 [Nitrospirota bacterium]